MKRANNSIGFLPYLSDKAPSIGPKMNCINAKVDANSPPQTAMSEIFALPVTSANRAGITGIIIPIPMESKTTVVKITIVGSFEFWGILNYSIGNQMITSTMSKFFCGKYTSKMPLS